jgi:hypothetical protein
VIRAPVLRAARARVDATSCNGWPCLAGGELDEGEPDPVLWRPVPNSREPTVAALRNETEVTSVLSDYRGGAVPHHPRRSAIAS